MKKLYSLMALLAAFLLLASLGFADTLILKNGEKVSGYFEGGSSRVIKFRTADGNIKEYDILSVEQIQFGQDPQASVSKPGSNPYPSSAPPVLRPGSERVTRPAATSTANTAYTLPAGTRVAIRMIDSIDSEVNKVGDSFVATLDRPLIVGGIEVAPRNADVRGRIVQVEGAGRLKGSAQLALELTQITVNGIPYALTTSEYEEIGEGRGGQTAKRAGGGAALGAIIGAIAGGGKGAAVGAGVGAGAGTAVQLITKGEKLKIPSETLLEFTLRAPLVIGAR